ncbi:MAG TPA: CBS domain-containing protein [Patescibacteria group bacterium]|nr:CBS domain-containing protein [Patescibacteria group bacterium]
MLVRDLMHSGLITCPSTLRLGDIAKLLRDNHVHSLVVVDAPGGEAAGLVSDTDLLAGEWLATDPERLATMSAMTAGELMSKPLISIAAGAPIDDAVSRMRRDHVARLLVEDGGRPVGVIAISDVIAALADVPLGRRTVRDVMSWGTVVCQVGTPLRSAARAMTDRRSRSLVVVDRDGRSVGVVTGYDLLPAMTMPTEQVDAGTVDRYMHAPVTIEPDASLQKATDLMLSREIHRLLVVDPDAPNRLPLGIISTTDIVTGMAGGAGVWR